MFGFRSSRSQFARIATVALTLPLAAAAMPAAVDAQILRNPTGVNVNAQGATSVFISFGNLDGYAPVEAIWCGEIESAAPDIGDRCVPGTIFGSLPVRYNLAQASGQDGMTDVMSIPPSVTRRAYQAAEDGQESQFFYVRRFADATGQGRPDQFVTVTCRLTGGGARTPLSMTDVRVDFATDDAVYSIAAGDTPPPIEARIAYTGTGRLRGRWEVVLPGEEPPESRDLISEAALPVEQRGQQRRYTELGRFNVFLPPVGEFTLEGPDPSKIPTGMAGQYMILLRIEASAEKEGDSNLESAGVGIGVVNSGSVAGFSVPPLRYWVGDPADVASGPTTFYLEHPAPEAALDLSSPLRFEWSGYADAVFYRLEVTTPAGAPALSAILVPPVAFYDAPEWLMDRTGPEGLRWRVVALDEAGGTIETTPWRVGQWR